MGDARTADLPTHGFSARRNGMPSGREDTALQNDAVGWALARMVFGVFGQAVVVDWPIFAGLVVLLAMV
jgi:hypothetical protein